MTNTTNTTSTTNSKGFWQSLKETPGNVFRFLSEGVKRIFAPRDDDYPEIGTQPFEGEPSGKKRY